MSENIFPRRFQSSWKRPSGSVRQTYMGIVTAIVEIAKDVAMLVISAAIILYWIAPRYPQVRWLQTFRMPNFPRSAPSPNVRRARNIFEGIQLIGLGLLLPIGYLFSTAIFFTGIEPVWVVVVAVLSLFCIALGIAGIVKSRSI